MIRDANEYDVDDIVLIEQQCFSSFWKKEQFLYELNENPYSFIKVFILDDEIIGYIDYWITFECCQLNKVTILPQYRRQGYACELLDVLVQEANLADCETIMLEVRVSNESAKQLYQRYGFIEVNVRKGYYTDNGEDASIMVKPLGGN